MSDDNPGMPPEAEQPQPPAQPAPPSFAPPGVPEKASGKAVTAMVLGILGIVLCPPVAVAAWILGHQERKAIAAQRSAQAGQGMATAGFIMGIIGTALMIIALLVFGLLFAGMVSGGFFSGMEGGGFEGEFFEDF